MCLSVTCSRNWSRYALETLLSIIDLWLWNVLVFYGTLFRWRLPLRREHFKVQKVRAGSEVLRSVLILGSDARRAANTQDTHASTQRCRRATLEGAASRWLVSGWSLLGRLCWAVKRRGYGVNQVLVQTQWPLRNFLYFWKACAGTITHHCQSVALITYKYFPELLNWQNIDPKFNELCSKLSNKNTPSRCRRCFFSTRPMSYGTRNRVEKMVFVAAGKDD